jgi:UDP-2-acetamido-3-amino-2,3-dideoxy-glucuronate N-acetyltransferase
MHDRHANRTVDNPRSLRISWAVNRGRTPDRQPLYWQMSDLEAERGEAEDGGQVEEPANVAPHRLIDDVTFGEGVVVHAFTNLYGCRIGSGTRIGTFVEIQRGATIGAACKIQSHTFICDGIRIEDEVFVGHGVMFVNDKRPRATDESGALQTESDWELLETVVERRVSIGSGATILGGVTIGRGAIVGAGAVVTGDVAPGNTVVGNPARPLRSLPGDG